MEKEKKMGTLYIKLNNINVENFIFRFERVRLRQMLRQ